MLCSASRCSIDDECASCKDTSLLGLTCCPVEASQLEDDQRWLFTATAFLVLLSVVGVIIQLWYLLKVKFEDGEWRDAQSGDVASPFAGVQKRIDDWRFWLIADHPYRTIREDQRVDDATDQTVTFFKAVEDGGEKRSGDIIQKKHLEKPGQPFFVSIIAPLALLLIYLVVISAFFAEDENAECYQCGQLRQRWYEARDETVFVLTLMRIVTAVCIVVSVLLALAVYIICPIQFGKGHGKVPQWEDPKPVNIAPMLASLPSFTPATSKSPGRSVADVAGPQQGEEASVLDRSHMIVNPLGDATIDMNTSQLSAIAPAPPTRQVPQITSPTEYSLRITGQKVGLEIINLGQGNVVSAVTAGSIAEQVRWAWLCFCWLPMILRSMRCASADRTNAEMGRDVLVSNNVPFAPLLHCRV